MDFKETFNPPWFALDAFAFRRSSFSFFFFFRPLSRVSPLLVLFYGLTARGAVLNSWKGPGCTEDALQFH